MNLNCPDLKTLRRLRPLARFKDEQLLAMLSSLEVKTARKSQLLMSMGCTREYYLFVLEGEVTLTAGDGRVNKTNYSTHDDLNPVAQIRPSMYDVHAVDRLNYLEIDKHFLTQFATAYESDEPPENFSVQEMDQGAELNTIAVQLFQDVMADKVSLPSLPDVAHRIQQVFSDPNVNGQMIAEILMTDPAITGKLIKVANSPVYQGLSSTNTLQSAIVRLGMDTTYKQVMAYAVNELFRSTSKLAADRMKQLWAHSRRVAAISRILAKKTGLFSQEQAMLAGLIHDLGVIVIVQYLQEEHAGLSDPDEIDMTINTMRAQVTSLLLRNWHFSEDVITVAEHCENWFRNEKEQPDLCDLVLVAQYHSYMGVMDMTSVPPISMIPAMNKLKMDVNESMQLIQDSTREIREIERLLQ